MPTLLDSFGKRLQIYLSAGIGVGCLASHSEAAISVTLYGPGAQSPTTTPATPNGIEFGFYDIYQGRYITQKPESYWVAYDGAQSYFTRGGDLVASGSYFKVFYSYYGAPHSGALLNSVLNYANISLNGSDGVFEAVAQFYLDGEGGGYLVGIARNDDGSSLSISDGKAAIDAAMVPEPSSLALLALGAGGLLARRRRV